MAAKAMKMESCGHQGKDYDDEARYPGVEIRYIRGFKSKADVDEWLAGSGRVDWLRSQGYAK
jgi:hypothetical protein